MAGGAVVSGGGIGENANKSKFVGILVVRTLHRLVCSEHRLTRPPDGLRRIRRYPLWIRHWYHLWYHGHARLAQDVRQSRGCLGYL